jgi:ribosome-associated toxin RatA of RatAB toxin-antitoxin module
MWEIKGDEFKYEETVPIHVPLPVVYKIVGRVDDYDLFLTDVAVAEMESNDICHMIVRAGPLRVNVRTKVTYKENEAIEFEMVEGPPVEKLAGSWEVREREDGGTDVTFKAYIKAGRAGNWLLKTASRYVERKALSLIGTFQEQVMKEYQETKAPTLG